MARGRVGIEALTGSEVVRAVNQAGGFSPGLAARCVLRDGRRCFIKAVSACQNPESPSFYRREGDVSSALPPNLPVPSLLGRYDDGDWVVLVFEDVEGHQPALPWTIASLAATLEALDRLTEATTPCPVPGLEPVGVRLEAEFNGFRTLAAAPGADGPDRVDPALRGRLDGLASLESGWATAAAGRSLLHCDLRADNLLIRSDGTVVVVDWPFAAVGAPWVDVLFMLPSVALDGGPSPDAVIDVLDPFAAVAEEAVDRVLAALTGFFVYRGTLPDPPGLPTVRAFQRAQGAVATHWLLRRLGSL